MPDPLYKLHYEVGLWSRTEGPSDIEYKVLKHLEDGEARLYVGENESSYGLSNSRDASGWVTRGSLFHVFHGCHYNRKPWVILDKKMKRRRRLKVYKISNAGIEAISQYEALRRYDIERLELAEKILNECRALHKARKT